MKSPNIKVHKNSSSKGSQSQVKSKPCIEYAGKTVVANYWVKIGFSREELGALREISKIFKHSSYQTTGNAAALVLSTALMHWEKLEPLLYADKAYCDAEGLLHIERFQAATIARKFNLKIPIDRRGVGAKQ
jgi:hypothetical protein